MNESQSRHQTPLWGLVWMLAVTTTLLAAGCAEEGDPGDSPQPQVEKVQTIEQAQAFGADDSYTTDEDVVLSQPEPGVLANDGGDGVITAFLNTPPANGSVALAASDSFST